MNDLAVSNNSDTNAHLQAMLPTGQYLTFLVANEGLGVDIGDVKEIIEITNITRVPMTPDYIRGVINLRGNVVPVVDLSSRIGHGVSEISKRSCIVLVEVCSGDEKQSLGMLVDQVQEILEITGENIQPAPTFGTDVRVEFIQAMGRIDDEFIILLDIHRVLSVTELAQLSDVANSSQSLIE